MARKTADENDAAAASRAETNTVLNPYARRIAEQYRDDFVTPRMFSGLWRGVEFVLLSLTGVVWAAWYLGADAGLSGGYIVLSLIGAALAVVLADVAHGYDLGFLKAGLLRAWRLAVVWAVTLALLNTALFFLFNDGAYSRGWFAGWFVGGVIVLGIARLLLQNRLRQWARNGRMERRAVLVGGGPNAVRLIRRLEAETDSDVRICGIFDDRDDGRSPPMVAGYPKLGTIAELVAFTRLTRIDMLIVTLPLSAEKRILSLLRTLWVLPIDIRLAAQSAALRFRPRTYSFVGTMPFIDVFDRPVADWDWIAKRVFDVVTACVALVLVSPILLVTAIAVKLDTPGPVIFRQKRHGFNNKIIEVYKFRSLRHADADPAASRIVTRNDDRVTRVGRFIRRTSIDELPQLVNVLRGELSMVGPRPHAVHAISSENETFVEIVEGYFGRHKVKPGITGWAQIKGWRGEVDRPDKLHRRFEHDLFYIENWSLLLDLYILVATPVSLLKSDSAY